MTDPDKRLLVAGVITLLAIVVVGRLAVASREKPDSDVRLAEDGERLDLDVERDSPAVRLLPGNRLPLVALSAAAGRLPAAYTARQEARQKIARNRARASE